MDWLTENWELISQIAGVVITIATIITGLTDTPIDNTIVDVIRRIFAQLSFAEPRDAEGSLKLPGTSPSNTLPVKTTDDM